MDLLYGKSTFPLKEKFQVTFEGSRDGFGKVAQTIEAFQEM